MCSNHLAPQTFTSAGFVLCGLLNTKDYKTHPKYVKKKKKKKEKISAFCGEKQHKLKRNLKIRFWEKIFFL